MSLEKLNPWMALVTNLGVLLGVIVLLVELTQNTQALRNQTEYANVSQWISLSQSTAMSPDLADLTIRGNAGLENLSEPEVVRYFSYLTAYVLVAEVSYDSILNGTTGYDAEANERFMLYLLNPPGARAYWEVSKVRFSERFVTYVDQLLAGRDS